MTYKIQSKFYIWLRAYKNKSKFYNWLWLYEIKVSCITGYNCFIESK